MGQAVLETGVTRFEQVEISNFLMHRRNGNFERWMGGALAAADPVNADRLRAAFPELWEKYADYMAVMESDDK